jgi:hypothetical protein
MATLTLTQPTVAQRALTCAIQSHEHFSTTRDKFTALTSLRVLQEANAFYQSDEKKAFDNLTNRSEDAYKRQTDPLYTVKSAVPNLLDDATLQELQNIKSKLTEGAAVLREIQQVAGAAFGDCAAQKIFGDLFAIPKYVTDEPSAPTIKTSSSTQPSNERPLFLQRIDLLSDIAKKFTYDQPADNMRKITEQLEEVRLTRPYTHLYFIHKKEHKELAEQLASDSDYGKNTMLGQYPTTNLERCRALQRTIMELALKGLETMVDGNQKDNIQTTLKILEHTLTDPKDLPNNKDNPAHILFGQLYTLHSAARQKNPALVDPADSRFNSDFGRHAFWCPNPNQVDPSTKTAAIEAVREVLKKAWDM